MTEAKWSVGDTVMSPNIERDHDENDAPRETAPGEIGEIVSVDKYEKDNWAYGVVFKDSGVWVTIEDAREGRDYLIAADLSPAPGM